jgi:hypothetical protein
VTNGRERLTWRNSWAVACSNQDNPSTKVPVEVRAAAAELEMMLMKTIITMTTMRNIKTSSSFLITESRSFSDAAMAFFSRCISLHTISSSSIDMSPFKSLSKTPKQVSESSWVAKAGYRSSTVIVVLPGWTNVR